MSTQQRTMAVNCLACGAELNFDPTIGKLHCEFCDSEFTAEEIESYYKAKEEKAAQSEGGTSSDGEWGEDVDDMRAYSCSACGAELIAEENTAAQICPYCGNNTISPAQFSGAARPDYVIPFSFSKQQAEQKYRDYYKGKSLLPKSFAQNNHIEDIQGVYVPFWLFTGTAKVDAHYEAYDKTENSNEIIKKYYDVRRSGTVNFEKVPADASERMPDDLMDSIEPYKFEELKEFSMAYLPGFLAEKFNVSQSEDTNRARQRVENTAKDLVRKTVRHDTISRTDEKVDVRFSDPEYGMLPVWYLVTKWQDKTYRFAMNGQTGKFTGDLPIDGGKMFMRILIVAVIVAVLAYLILGDMAVAVIGAMIGGAVAGGLGYASMKPVSNARQANDYIKDRLELTQSSDQYLRTDVQKKPKQQ